MYIDINHEYRSGTDRSRSDELKSSLAAKKQGCLSAQDYLKDSRRYPIRSSKFFAVSAYDGKQHLQPEDRRSFSVATKLTSQPCHQIFGPWSNFTVNI